MEMRQRILKCIFFQAIMWKGCKLIENLDLNILISSYVLKFSKIPIKFVTEPFIVHNVILYSIFYSVFSITPDIGVSYHTSLPFVISFLEIVPRANYQSRCYQSKQKIKLLSRGWIFNKEIVFITTLVNKKPCLYWRGSLFSDLHFKCFFFQICHWRFFSAVVIHKNQQSTLFQDLAQS